MKLMRNVTPDGQCKYAAVRMDKIAALEAKDQVAARSALEMLADLGLLENPKPGDREEFFLIKLKDVYAEPALVAYANSVGKFDPEFAADVYSLTHRAGLRNPFHKEPDTTFPAGVPPSDAPSPHGGRPMTLRECMEAEERPAGVDVPRGGQQ